MRAHLATSHPSPSLRHWRLTLLPPSSCWCKEIRSWGTVIFKRNQWVRNILNSLEALPPHSSLSLHWPLSHGSIPCRSIPCPESKYGQQLEVSCHFICNSYELQVTWIAISIHLQFIWILIHMNCNFNAKWIAIPFHSQLMWIAIHMNYNSGNHSLAIHVNCNSHELHCNSYELQFHFIRNWCELQFIWIAIQGTPSYSPDCGSIEMSPRHLVQPRPSNCRVKTQAGT